ncbi:MAG: dihydrofolate reductase family protein [Clostridia bacterium]
MKKVTIEMACSINGIIATEEGQEDFLSQRGWQIMLELLKEYDVLIWGRKTWENVLSWGEVYLKDLENINMIILTTQSDIESKLKNVIYCHSIEECLQVCENLHYEKLFISGGATVNNAFMERKLVDNIILNYNPFVLNKGISLFTGNYFENSLKLEKIVPEKEDIVQLHYRVIN